MGAICGIYYKNKVANVKEYKKVMMDLGKYRFEKSGTVHDGSIILGCHQNCLTPESINETLPVEDDTGLLVITADAIIDNREELFTLLAVPTEKTNMPDSLVILEAYKKWGTTCPDKLVGDFSFVIWDKKKQELFCARDHVGKRSFYYYNDKDIFAFSTLINPLFQIEGIKRALNETYIADFLAITGIHHEIGSDITLYENIYQLLPAHAMTVNRSGISKWCYWEIKKTKEIQFESDAEYEEAFRKVFTEAVRCRLRSIKRVGIQLSGGLDSGSVACLAAEELKKRNEKLYSFTQVPMEGYKNWLPDNQLPDEREYVEAISRFTGNIVSHYISSEGKSPITEINESIAMFEQPYKCLANIHWINEINRTASSMGIGVLLSGQSGNSTISWGNVNAYLTHLLKVRRFTIFIREIKAYSQLKKINPIKLCLSVMLNFMPYAIKNFIHKVRKRKDYKKFLSPIDPDFYATMGIDKRFEKYNIDPLFLDHSDSFNQRLKMLSPAGFSHLGALETKISLAFGVEKRDPTRDKRVIEFCINLPEDQWVRDGNGRRFIRCAMKGYMPDEVRLNTTVRGKQAADWCQRIMPEWGKICEEIATIGKNELECKYLDIVRIKQFLSENKELKYDNDGSGGVILLLRSLIFARFLRSFKG